MGYVIQKLSPATPVTKSTQILRCMKEWPDQVEFKDQNKGVEYSCYTSGECSTIPFHSDLFKTVSVCAMTQFSSQTKYVKKGSLHTGPKRSHYV